MSLEVTESNSLDKTMLDMGIDPTPEGLYKAHQSAARQLERRSDNVAIYEQEVGETSQELVDTKMDTINSEPLDISNAEYFAAEAQARLDHARDLVGTAESKLETVSEVAAKHYQDNKEDYINDALREANDAGVSIEYPAQSS